MMHGELYLVKDGSQSPLRLGHFVQLRAAPPNAQYTTYFYNRTDGDKVHMVSYQYGSDELQDILDNFSEEFGALRLGSSRAK